MNANTSAVARELLRRALGAEATFRDGQLESILSLVDARARLFLVQRTGWGKSLVYFIATRILRDRGAGPTLLISPLLALMRNQIAAAERIGVKALSINSSNTEDWSETRRRIARNDADVLLVSPERLANEWFMRNVLGPVAASVGLFVVDEVHCISDWGHDFRPDYRRIVRILQNLPSNIPVLGTTATANDRVVSDVVRQLGPSLQTIRGPLRRETLRLQALRLSDDAERLAWLAGVVPTLTGSGIVYTLTVRDARRVAEWLRARGIGAAAYWGGLDNDERLALEDRLLRNDLKVLVATSALGMGFDKPDLGFVIHYQRPTSVVHYYQQVGRAGRAISSAVGVLLSGREDDEIAEYFITSAFPKPEDVTVILSALEESDAGLTLDGILARVNLSKSRAENILKNLSVESPAPVTKIQSRWMRTPVKYTPDVERQQAITSIRLRERERMAAYVDTRECLMVFLSRELDDPDLTPCGRCANCTQPIVSFVPSPAQIAEAKQFLMRGGIVVEPRKRWPALGGTEFNGMIRSAEQYAAGRALAYWNDAGWGEEIRRGKQEFHRFRDELVQAAAELIERWGPKPEPVWLTFVPSRSGHPLVADFAARLAAHLGLQFVDAFEVIARTPHQKLMQNSAQQARNVLSTFALRGPLPGGPLLLVDDIVDSRWTFTVLAAMLRRAGSGPVFPFALANAGRTDD